MIECHYIFPIQFTYYPKLVLLADKNNIRNLCYVSPVRLWTNVYQIKLYLFPKNIEYENTKVHICMFPALTYPKWSNKLKTWTNFGNAEDCLICGVIEILP